ncbi:hypothetical protein J2X76_005437 [Neorhizobium sp. 2083]|uniref:hypothetical protein n=1 Tax=Neorhizobium sp. 2083 TaxID=2817762 RepID=UPI002862647C|nr:hypothetical protein [Neorhizobium sp. 2083]MDR6820240.1 hypothetical protein [Neorhizobium sp. 2083]
MQPAAAQLEREKQRKRRRAAERWQRHLAELRRRREQADRDRRKRLLWLIMLWLTILESIPTPTFFPVAFAEADPPQQKRQPKPPRKSQKKDEFDNRDDPRSEDDRRYLSDYSPRYGEESQEVYDGLTWNDIIAYNKVHRPWLFPASVPVPGTPKRYIDEPLHVWTLLDHLKHDFLRKDAITALKLLVDGDAHPWIDACAATTNGWKQLCYCRGRTPDMTIAAFPRAAALWREEQRREGEERKREAKETPENNGPKPPGGD